MGDWIDGKLVAVGDRWMNPERVLAIVPDGPESCGIIMEGRVAMLDVNVGADAAALIIETERARRLELELARFPTPPTPEEMASQAEKSIEHTSELYARVFQKLKASGMIPTAKAVDAAKEGA